MMKRWRILLLVLLAALLLPAIALAEKTVEIHTFLMCSPGDVRLPFYPDYSHHIGEGLTKDDFIITYASSSPKVTVEADGKVHIASGVALYTNFPLEITYTPKVEGVGETTVFACRLRTTAAIKQITPEKTFYRFRNGESISPIVELHGGDTSMIASVAADGDGLEVTYRQWGTDSIRLHITALKPGLSKVIITAFNGTTAEIEVDVVGEPTQFQFAKEHFICYPGETVDLGLDTGNGPHGLEFYYSYSADVTQDGVSVGGRGFNSMAGTFNAGEAGEYRIVCSWRDVVGETRVSVVDRSWCEEIALSTGALQLDQPAEILMYDNLGESVYQRFAVTKGADLVTLTGRKINAKAAGTVEITVTNPDGSTVIRSFEVTGKPTQMFLNATEVELDAGDTFDLVVSFDQGSLEHTCTVDNGQEDEYGQAIVSIIGDRIHARRSGTVTVTVRAGEFTRDLTVHVKDSDQVLRLVLPPANFNINQTFQLQVADRTGKVYPARFYIEPAFGNCTVTEDGLLTGVREGREQVWAELENGLKLRAYVNVSKIPAWIVHENLTFHENDENATLKAIQSDVGTLSFHEVEIAIADESIATATVSGFRLHKTGTTEVTLTAVKGGAKCSFFLTVEPADDTLYIFADGKRHTSYHYTIDIPCDFSKKLPDVTDYYGNKISVTWKITSESPAMGNPNKTAFKLSNGSLKATWVDGHCTLTATTRDGRTIVMFATAYRLPDKIKFRYDSYTVKVGEHEQTEVEKDEPMPSIDRVGDLTWTVADPSIIRFEERFPATGMPTVTGLKPGTTTLTATQPNGAKAVCTITVVDPDRRSGDTDSSGSVSMNDVIALLQHCAGEDVDISLSNANVNGDGKVDLHDALLIMQYVAGWNIALQ